MTYSGGMAIRSAWNQPSTGKTANKTTPRIRRAKVAASRLGWTLHYTPGRVLGEWLLQGLEEDEVAAFRTLNEVEAELQYHLKDKGGLDFSPFA